MTIKKELTAMTKDITAIGKKLDTLLKAVEKSKTTVTKASKAKAVKTKPAKKAPVKKGVVEVTATDQVLKIIIAQKKVLIPLI